MSERKSGNKKKNHNKRGAAGSRGLLLALSACAAGLFFLAAAILFTRKTQELPPQVRVEEPAPEENPVPPEQSQVPVQIEPAGPEKIPPQKKDLEIPPARNGAALVWVFDDGGHNLADLDKFLALEMPLDIAVLPRLPHSAEAARRVRAGGKELMLHQPMQAKDLAYDPGPGAVMPEMNSFQIARVIQQNVDEIGPVAGVNNHEGSLICENEIKIMAVLEKVDSLGLFFLDSRTTPDSKAPLAALELGIPIYERNVFLDNVKTREEVVSEIARGIAIANKTGRCIFIGHVWAADLIPPILREFHAEFLEKGYKFETVTGK